MKILYRFVKISRCSCKQNILQTNIYLFKKSDEKRNSEKNAWHFRIMHIMYFLLQRAKNLMLCLRFEIAKRKREEKCWSWRQSLSYWIFMPSASIAVAFQTIKKTAKSLQQINETYKQIRAKCAASRSLDTHIANWWTVVHIDILNFDLTSCQQNNCHKFFQMPNVNVSNGKNSYSSLVMEKNSLENFQQITMLA